MSFARLCAALALGLALACSASASAYVSSAKGQGAAHCMRACMVSPDMYAFCASACGTGAHANSVIIGPDGRPTTFAEIERRRLRDCRTTCRAQPRGRDAYNDCVNQCFGPGPGQGSRPSD